MYFTEDRELKLLQLGTTWTDPVYSQTLGSLHYGFL